LVLSSKIPLVCEPNADIRWQGQGFRLAHFESAFLDQYYQDIIRPDEVKLIDMESIAVTVGVEYIVIDNGKLVEKHEREF
jgi:hypothetical protein